MKEIATSYVYIDEGGDVYGGDTACGVYKISSLQNIMCDV